MNYYDEIKENLIKSELYDRVKDYSKDRNKVKVYFETGKLLHEAGKEYGKNIIKQYSEKLVIEVGSKYKVSTLYKMRKFYEVFSNEKLYPLGTKLSWSHYRELLVLKEYKEIRYYIEICEKNSLTKRELHEKIKNNEYNRLSIDTKNKIINEEKLVVSDIVPNPILIKNKNNIEIATERALHDLILEDIESFMKELGNSFCFMGSEYKIKIGDTYHKIDLLLFNIKYNAYVVVELKVTQFKVEYISQVHKYMNYIDKNIKKDFQDKTIGIIICKKEDKFVIEYCSDDRIMHENMN